MSSLVAGAPSALLASMVATPGFRFVLGGIGPTSNQTNASAEMKWVLSRPWAAAYLSASVSGDATVEQLQERSHTHTHTPM